MPHAPVLYGPDARPVPAGMPAAIRDAAGGHGRLRASLDGGPGLPAGMTVGPGFNFPYDAANYTSTDMGDWLPWIRSPDQEINYYRDRMVARQRDLYRNDGWAKGAIGRILDSTIGATYRLIAKPDWRALQLYGGPGFDEVWAREFRQVAEAMWREYAEDLGRYCDKERRLTMSQMFRLDLGHKLVDGESLMVSHWRPDRMGYGAAKFATCFEGIDPDRLSNPYQQVDTRFMRGGIELDEDGVRLAAHIRKAEPNDWYNAMEAMTWVRVPFEDDDGFVRVIHDFDAERFGQHRGVSVFAPILSRMKMLARYYGVELQAATVASIFGTFITSPYDDDLVQEALTAPKDQAHAYQDVRTAFHEKHRLSLNSVRIPMLAPGEKIQTVSAARPHGEFTPFTHEMLRSVAAALGVSAEQVHQDYSEANYSSIRAGIVEAEKTFERRKAEFSLNTATPAYACWLHEAMDRGFLPLPKGAPDFLECRTAYSRCRWLGPAAGWVDPVAERQGVVLGLDMGESTLEEVCAVQGMDYEENLAQRAYELSLFKKYDLPLPQWFGEKKSTAQEQIQKPQAA
jgi:lambda family phage portal protein